MSRRPIEPLLWLLFSAGGVFSALFVPGLLLLFGLAFPLGWLQPPAYEHLLGLVGHPLGRLLFVALSTLSLFHWAHRFRYTLYDGLQIKHLKEVIAALCYGGAIIGSLLSVYLAWQVP